MHKSLLKFAFGKAFALLDIAVDLVRHAYGVADKSGLFVLDEVDAAIVKVRESVDKAIDEL